MANILGGNGNDTLWGDSDPLNLNDVLNSGWLAGDDEMIGGNGDDTYHVNSIGDVVQEGPGQGIDTVKSQIFSYTLTADVENLVLQESDRSGTLNANGTVTTVISLGAPTAVVGTGNTLNNAITGNSNGNYLYGLDGADTILGLDGNDWVFGGVGSDSLDGGFGNDALWGEDNNDTMLGGDGADTLYGGAGDDSMTGGTGNDIFYVDQIGDKVVEGSVFETLLPPGIDTVYASITETLDTNVENLTLTGLTNLNGTGNGSANVIKGNVGANILDGKAGADTMEGSTGNDTYYVDIAGDVVTELANAGSDLVYSTVTHTLTVDVEKLTLQGTTAINGTGNASANTINGNSADNTLKGLGGNDTLIGAGGVDEVIGGAGGDRIRGGLGNDVLYANTTAVANDGATDRFVFNTELDAILNVDQIVLADFAVGMEGSDDEIVLENLIFDALTAVGGGNVGTLANFYQGAGLDGSGQFDLAGIYFNSTNGYLYYNEDGTTAGSTLFAVVAPGTALSGDEFTLE